VVRIALLVPCPRLDRGEHRPRPERARAVGAEAIKSSPAAPHAPEDQNRSREETRGSGELVKHEIARAMIHA